MSQYCRDLTYDNNKQILHNCKQSTFLCVCVVSRNAVWPGGVRPSHKEGEEGEEGGERARLLRCVLARSKLIGSVPDDLRRLLGTRRTTQGMARCVCVCVCVCVCECVCVCVRSPISPLPGSATYCKSAPSTAGCVCVSSRPHSSVCSPPTPSHPLSGPYGNTYTPAD